MRADEPDEPDDPTQDGTVYTDADVAFPTDPGPRVEPVPPAEALPYGELARPKPLWLPGITANASANSGRPLRGPKAFNGTPVIGCAIVGNLQCPIELRDGRQGRPCRPECALTCGYVPRWGHKSGKSQVSGLDA